MNSNFFNNVQYFILFITVLFVITALHLLYYFFKSLRATPKTVVTHNTDRTTKIVPTISSNLNSNPTTPIVETVAKVSNNVSTATASKSDDLKKVEGIGPAIEEILKDRGILTYQNLSSATPAYLKSILNSKGSRFIMHDPSTWPKQANMLVNGKLEELKAFQDELNKKS
jgi:predicted flap endonuclease-1-like 5' DNA nuclease